MSNITLTENPDGTATYAWDHEVFLSDGYDEETFEPINPRTETQQDSYIVPADILAALVPERELHLIFPTEADARQWAYWAWLETSPREPLQSDDTLYYGSFRNHPTDGSVAVRIKPAHAQEPGLLTQAEIDSLVEELPADWTVEP
jgi:hypothetical protein